MKKHRDGKFLLNKQSKFTFVAPDETEYSNIQSLNAFAKEHGLSQPSVSQLRSGWIDSVRGWTLKGGNLPKVGRVVRYWPLSRVMKTYSFDERKSAASYVYKVHKINIVSADEWMMYMHPRSVGELKSVEPWPGVWWPMKKMFNPSINRKMKSVQPKLLGYYTEKEAADVLGVSVTTLRQRQFRSDSAYRWNKDETLFLLLDTSHKRVNDYDYYEINAFNQFSKTYNERPKVQAARARGMRVPSYGGTQKLLVINSQKDLDKYYRSLQTQLRLDGHVNVHI